MLGTSAAEYAFIRICISILHCIAPLSVLYCFVLTTDLATIFRMRPAIELWLFAEALFWTCFYFPYRWYLQHAAIHPPSRSKEERRKLVDYVKAEITDPEQYIRGWFKGAEVQDIRRQDVKDWLTWAFFDRDWEEGKDEDEIEEYTLEIESMLRKNLRPGNGRAKSLRLTIDPVKMLHRSLLWYFCISVVDILAYLKLQWLGFRFHRLPITRFLTLFPFRPVGFVTRYHSRAKCLSYWHRPHRSTVRLPVLFIHGIGIGLYPYADFLSDINSLTNDQADSNDGTVGILAIEIMPISFRITHRALSKDELCTELRHILAEHNYDRFVLVSHSYGSVISSFIMSDPILRPKVASALLVDPVSFLLHTPDVAYNFTVRQPQQANEWQLWYFASKDPGVAHALGRHFFWSQNVIWKKDVEDFVNEGKRLTVSLGGKDLIVNTAAIGRYLANGSANQEGRTMNENKDCISQCSTEDAWKQRKWRGNGLDVLWFDHLDHGQAFDTNEMRAQLVRVVQSYCESG